MGLPCSSPAWPPLNHYWTQQKGAEAAVRKSPSREVALMPCICGALFGIHDDVGDCLDVASWFLEWIRSLKHKKMGELHAWKVEIMMSWWWAWKSCLVKVGLKRKKWLVEAIYRDIIGMTCRDSADQAPSRLPICRWGTIRFCPESCNPTRKWTAWCSWRQILLCVMIVSNHYLPSIPNSKRT